MIRRVSGSVPPEIDVVSPQAMRFRRKQGDPVRVPPFSAGNRRHIAHRLHFPRESLRKERHAFISQGRSRGKNATPSFPAGDPAEKTPRPQFPREIPQKKCLALISGGRSRGQNASPSFPAGDLAEKTHCPHSFIRAPTLIMKIGEWKSESEESGCGWQLLRRLVQKTDFSISNIQFSISIDAAASRMALRSSSYRFESPSVRP